jgi:tRNA(Ile2) C34 agmatinyltransferase TiaS
MNIQQIPKTSPLLVPEPRKCDKCGKPSSSGECPDCRYRNGGQLPEREETERDIAEKMLRHSRAFFLEGSFTSEQLMQISPSER